MADLREDAVKWLNNEVPADKLIYSNGPTAADFTRITDLTHQGLLAQWRTQEVRPPGRRQLQTSCNAFAGVYSRTVCKTYLGGIDPHADLIRMKREYAWVDSWVAAGSDLRPKPGDLVKSKGQHVLVSVGFAADGSWITAQGGQGGPRYSATSVPDSSGTPRWPLLEGQSRDLVKRIAIQPFNWADLEGWIDIELFVFGPPQEEGGETPAPGTTASLWRNTAGAVVHPDAPVGGGGAGFFRVAGTVSGDPLDRLPNPWSPTGRGTDPGAFARAKDEGDDHA